MQPKPITIALALTLATTLATISPVFAQEEGRDSGFYTGLRFVQSTLNVDNDGDGSFFIKDDGAGAQLYIGYSFNAVFSLELDLTGVGHPTSDPTIDANFGAVQWYAHYRFLPGHGFRPYVKGGLAGYGLVFQNNNDNISIEGGGVPIGIGFDYFFNRHFTIGADFSHNIVKYERAVVNVGGANVGFEIDREGSMTSLGLALAYYF